MPDAAGPVIFGEHEQKVIDQLVRCLAPEEGSRGALCADGHFGYSAPIGGVMPYAEHVSPSGWATTSAAATRRC